MLTRAVGRALLGLAALGLVACETPAAPGDAPHTSAVRSVAEQREGDRAHPQILARYGGPYDDPELAAYVERIGRRLAAVSEQPHARWTFTVLDTPTVNAFAIPGGYVYVTRGLVALAGDEAQLAGVIGHEIGHVTAGHSAHRRSRGTVAGLGLLVGALGASLLGVDPSAVAQLGQVVAGGILASYSRAEELEADRLGIRYLVRAGYDPYAQADFLERMAAFEKLQAKIAGRGYNPSRVDFFATHPATAERTREAIRAAERLGHVTTVGAARNRDRFLDAIDGMVWGQSAAQGFVDGRRFSHPKLGFTFTVPPGFTIHNTASAVIASGPQHSRFVFDGDRDPGGRLADYITRIWVPRIRKSVRTGPIAALREGHLHGMPTASAIMPLRLGSRIYEAVLVVYRLNGQIYRITGLSPQGSGMRFALEDAARSFRRLSAAEKAVLARKEHHIRIVRVRAGDTVDRMARRMKVETLPLDYFRVLNGLRPGQPLKRGMRVKLIR